MPGGRLPLKVWSIFAGGTLLAGGLVFLWLSGWLERELTRQAWLGLEEKAALVGEWVLPLLPDSRSPGSPDPALQGRIGRLAGAARIRLTVISPAGTVLADSHRSPARMARHRHRPEILAVRSHGEGRATRRSETLGVDMLYYALPAGAGPKAYVRTALPLAWLEERIASWRTVLAWGIGLGTVAALAAGLLLAASITRPLEGLTRTAEALAAGDFTRRSPLARKDLFGQLSAALDRIARRAGESLEHAAADRGRLLTVLSGMSEGVLAVDREERVIQANQAAGRILNVAPEAMVGRPIWEVTRVREICEALASTLATGSDSEAELRISLDGQERGVQTRTAPLKNGEGGLMGALLVLHDVSHLQKLERVRRDFVANVSHDLKTPIAAIQGLVETLIDDERMSRENRRRFLVKVRRQTQRLSSIVSELLALSRLESSQGLLERTELDFRGVVTAACAAARQQGEERRIEIDLREGDDPVPVRGDRKGLAQLVRNLLDNALRHTPPGGRVSVRLGLAGDHSLLEVEDTGEGIEPRDQSRIFERFYRVDKARSRADGGTGLGLSIVKHVTLGHGGSVSVESSPGRGSVFRVSIPLHRGKGEMVQRSEG